MSISESRRRAQRKYRETHRKQLRAANRKYQLKNREKINAYRRRYWKLHPDKGRPIDTEELRQKRNEYSRKWYANHSKKINAKRKKDKKKYPQKWKTRYRIYNNNHREKLLSQVPIKHRNDKCSICGFSSTNHKKKYGCSLHIDHDHITNRFRGLLCRDCNILLGAAKDKLSILEAAKQYLIDSGGGH